MPTIESLVRARPQITPGNEFSSLTRDELELELEKLRRREILFDATEQAARMGHYEWDYQGNRLEFCSEEYANLFDMSVEEVMESQTSREKTLQYIHPDDHDRYQLAMAELRDTRSISVEYRILRADGSIRHVREFGTVVLDDAGIAHGCFGLLHDISVVFPQASNSCA